MELRFTISVEDLEVVQNNMEYFLKLFPRFKILSDHFTVEDERFTEMDSMFEYKEVVFEHDNINNLWAMAKFVQELKIETL